MNHIKFINQEIFTKQRKRGILQNVVLVCAILDTVGNLLLVLMGDMDEITLFSGLIIPIWLWFYALKRPEGMQEPIQVPEELMQIENGVCVFIPQIDRGDRYGIHQENIICQKDRINNVVYYPSHDMVEVVGRPVIHFDKGQGQEPLVLDTAEEFDEDYVLRIYCNEENREGILHIIQTGLERIALQQDWNQELM